MGVAWADREEDARGFVALRNVAEELLAVAEAARAFEAHRQGECSQDDSLEDHTAAIGDSLDRLDKRSVQVLEEESAP